MQSGRDHHRTDAPRQEARLSICPILGDVLSNHSIKVVSAGRLHCDVCAFPFVINVSLVGRWFETV